MAISPFEEGADAEHAAALAAVYALLSSETISSRHAVSAWRRAARLEATGETAERPERRAGWRR